MFGSAITGATLVSFVLAFLFFLFEFLVFHTVTAKGVMSPMIVASTFMHAPKQLVFGKESEVVPKRFRVKLKENV